MSVEGYLAREGRWQDEMTRLRALVLETGLSEELKWGHPCYSLDGKNVVLIHGFKDYCALLFMKGVLMDDPAGLLVIQTENVQAARQIRFTTVADIEGSEEVLRGYLANAIAVERAGLQVPMKKTADFPVPVEFQRRMDELPALREAFQALTPGRQRAYLLHFAQPKQSQTRAARVEKMEPRIFDGLGLDD